MVTKQVVVVLNDFKRAEAVLKKGFDLAKSKEVSVEVLYVYEKEHITLKDLFFTDDFKSLDKEKIKSEIKEKIELLNEDKNVAIFVYQEDTLDRVLELLENNKDARVVIGYHKDITKRVLQKLDVPVLVVKEGAEYKNIAFVTNSENLELIKRLKSNYSNVEILFDYRFIPDSTLIDPSIGSVPIESIDIEKIELEQFEKLKKETNLEGKFFINGTEEMELYEYINYKNFDLVYIDEEYKDLLGLDAIIESMLDKTNCDICFV